MKRNLKVLGVAIAAMLAMSVMASAASAQQYTAASYPVVVSGSQSTTHEFTIGGNRRVKCSTASFTSPSQGAAASTITITPTYSGCTIKIPSTEGELDATVTMGSCDYLFNEPTGLSSTVNITCSSGAIVIHVYNGLGVTHNEANTLCQYEVGAQNNLSSVTYENGGGNVTAKANVSAIAVKRLLGTTTNCGGASQTATYTGNTLLQGNGGAVAIDVG